MVYNSLGVAALIKAESPREVSYGRGLLKYAIEQKDETGNRTFGARMAMVNLITLRRAGMF